ncbi:DMT family transporter [Anaeromicropila herbilytica]|uniref:Membrane protein n=1 Tax=Anaeromicropila herbilytica TaxID=2785025 RepID=A0A7R7EMY8_9FIRM|nr:DMT family transporter [Anaeromicropila herbilytica]BCN31753.1 membrane protein [Anaeromicropila herbilytica]
MLGIIIAIVSGALMSVQGVFNTGVTKQTSMWTANTFVQATALIVCVIAWYVTGKESSLGAIFRIDHKYMLLGGVMGAFITYTVIESITKLGPARAAMLIVVAQLVVSYVIELFGMFGTEKVDFEMRKLIGLAIVIVGIITFKWE